MQHNVLYVPPESAYTPDPCSPTSVPAEAPRAPHPARAPRTATPALFSTSERAERRFWEFFTAHIRNRNTRVAHLAAVRRFAQWCERRGLALGQVEPMVSERTRDGIAAARKRGRAPGRPPLDPETVSAARKLIEGSLSPARAAKQLKIGRATAYRIAAAMRDEDPAPLP